VKEAAGNIKESAVRNVWELGRQIRLERFGTEVEDTDLRRNKFSERNPYANLIILST